MARTECWFEQDLKKPVQVKSINGNVFSLDNQGTLVGVKCFSDGEAATLDGSVTGYCILADGTTVSVSGTRSGNQAYILMPQSALAVPGPIKIAVKLTEGSAISTLLAVVSTVYKTRTDTVITPSSQVITDWSQQIAASLQECEDVVAQSVKYGSAQSLTDAQKAQARTNIGAPSTATATTSANGLMSSSDKTKLNGIETQANKTLYDTTLSNSGQAADAKTTGDKISDLKSALNASGIVRIYDMSKTQGRYIDNSTNLWASNSNARFVLVPVNGVESIELKAKSSNNSTIAALRSFTDMTTGTSPDFSTETGWTTSKKITKGTSFSGTLPSDAKYLYVYYGPDAIGSMVPQSLLINGYDITETAIDNVTDLIKDCIQSMASSEVSELSSLASAPTNRYFTASGARIKELNGGSFPYTLGDNTTFIVTIRVYSGSYRVITIENTSHEIEYYGSTNALSPSTVIWYDNHVKKADVTSIENELDAITEKELSDSAGLVQVYTDFEYTAGWYKADGTLHNNEGLTLFHTQKVQVNPNTDYYMAVKYNRGSNEVEGAFFDKNGAFLSALQPADLVSYTYQTPNGATGSSLTNYVPLYKFTTPANAYYFSYNATNSATYKYRIYIASVPVFRHFGTGDLIIPKGDPAYQYFGHRKLCVIGPSTVMIDRLYRPGTENGGNFNNDGTLSNEYVVGFQEYLIPYWEKVDSYGYSGATYPSAWVTTEEARSIYDRIVTDQLDLSGYDDFLFVMSGNGFSGTNNQIGTLESYSDLGDETTYIGALRQIIEYIYTANPQAKIYIQTMRRYGGQYRYASTWGRADQLNAELEKMSSLIGCKIIDMVQSGFNQYTTPKWCYDSPTYQDGGHWNHVGSREVGLVTRKAIIGY